MQASRKTLLARLVISLLILLFIAFAYVSFKVISWSPNQLDSTSELALPEGETKLVIRAGTHLWLTRLSEQQRQNMASLAEHVFLTSGCLAAVDICQIKAQTKNSAVLVLFINEKPPQLAFNQPWYGGYVNPLNSAVYDLLGRGYRSNPDDAPRYIHHQ